MKGGESESSSSPVEKKRPNMKRVVTGVASRAPLSGAFLRRRMGVREGRRKRSARQEERERREERKTRLLHLQETPRLLRPFSSKHIQSCTSSSLLVVWFAGSKRAKWNGGVPI